MNDKLINKCEICGEISFNKPILHKFECSNNDLSKEENEKQFNEKYIRFYYLMKEMDVNEQVANKMSYVDLASYLINHIGGNLNVNSLNCAVVDKIYDILVDLGEKEYNKEIDKIDNLA